MADGKRQQALTAALRLARSIDGITGVDYGYAYRAGKPTRRRAVRFHVERKRSRSALAADQMIPDRVLGIGTDVVEASYEPHGNPFEAHDPVRPGVSIGNVTTRGTGTLGAIVRDDAGNAYVLSNWHVLCASTEAATGEEISQPGPRHLGPNLPRPVAKLDRWLAPAQGFDAAIARLLPGIESDDKLLDAAVTLSGVSEPVLGQILVKSSVMSGVTSARVDGINGSFKIPYGRYGDQDRWIPAIRLVREAEAAQPEISLQGDSGAVWADPATNSAVALHVAGEDGLGPLNEYALAQSLARILKLLGVTIA